MNQGQALIVGGTRGLGRVVARQLAEQGRRVTVIGRRPPDEADRLPGITHRTLDLQDSAALSTVLETLGDVHELVFLQRHKGPEDWAAELAVSLTTTRLVIDVLAPRLSAGASIVVVSSIVGELIADGAPAGYHVAKAALNQLARFYAVRLGPSGVRVNAVSAATFLKDESRDFYLKNEKLLELYRAMIPLGRLGEAREIAQAILFLLGPGASFITGQVLTVDGGLTVQSPEALARRLVPVDAKATK
jgi:NAD(P)-dependent dehydrogenase (short-subunit alcohol dehydrogenase family)